jgi:hypothetical protein
MGGVNLADPNAEPTDAELAELMKRAFSGVREADELRRRRLREEIAQARTAALAHLEALLRNATLKP